MRLCMEISSWRCLRPWCLGSLLRNSGAFFPSKCLNSFLSLSLCVLPPNWIVCFLKVAVCGSCTMKTFSTMPFQSCSSSGSPRSPIMTTRPRTPRGYLISQCRSESSGLEIAPIGGQEQLRERSLEFPSTPLE